jgi:peptidoglycan/LPS O-acetylase OafA/YrhL
MAGDADYRPDIDGLRAVAVLAVVGYHAGAELLQGGFVGVDVFFVISGFLITRLILRDLDRDRFSLVDFWGRRVRRILPALVTVVAASWLAMHLMVPVPAYYTAFLDSVLAQAVFVSNLHFMAETGYFADPAETAPLLHLWSLAVEEQFYLLYPLVVAATLGAAGLVTRRRQVRPALALAVAAIALASFGYGVWLVDLRPGAGFVVPGVAAQPWSDVANATAGFFLLPARAWELAVGAVLALAPWRLARRWQAELLGLTGLALVAAAVFGLSQEGGFPGVKAVLPVVGAACLIAANRDHRTAAFRLLAFGPVVWIGLLSYALYLWHWPVFVIARLYNPDATGGDEMLLFAGLSLGLAWLTFRFVETPIRRRLALARPRRLWAGAAASLAGMALLGGAGAPLAEAPGRPAPIPQPLAEAAEDHGPRWAPCFKARTREDYRRQGPCILSAGRATASPGADPDPPGIVVWGDSHAGALLPGFDAAARAGARDGAFFARAACVPLLGVRRDPPRPGCAAFRQLVLDYIGRQPVRDVVLVGRWSVNVAGRPDGRTDTLIRDAQTAGPLTSEAALAAFERGLTRTIDALLARVERVWLIREVPLMYDVLDGRTDLRQVRSLPAAAPLPLSAHRRRLAPVDAVLDRAAARPGVRTLDPARILCAGGHCRFRSGGKVVYRDDDHLNATGARLLVPLLQPIFARRPEL